MFAASAHAVDELETYVESLVSLHTEIGEPIDWVAISERPRPPKPECTHDEEKKAKAKLASFRPSLLHLFRGGSTRVRNGLEARLEAAKAVDERKNHSALTSHTSDLRDWEEDVVLASRLLAGDAEAIRQVVLEMNTLSETALLGTAVEFDMGPNFIHARPKVHGPEVVPNVRRRQLASGRLSETQMPARQFQELYQDHIASVALRIAGDLFRVLPLPEVYVTCVAEMLNSQTGHMEPTPILSVQFVRDTFRRLDLSGIDPSDALRNFRHTMEFSKTKGFGAIIPIGPPD